MTERTGGSDVAISETVGAGRTATLTASTAPSGSPPRRRRRWRSPSRGPRATRRAAPGWRSSTSSSRTPTARSTGSWSTASRTSSARAWCRPRSSRSTARARSPVAGLTDGIKNIAPDAQHHAHVERGLRRVGDAARARPGARLREEARRVRGAARRQAAARRHARGHAGRVRGRRSSSAFRAVELLGREEAGVLAEDEAQLLRAAHAAREAHDRRSRRSRWRARCSRRSAARATSRTPGCRASSATRRCSPSGRGRPTCCRSTCCARSAQGGSLEPIEREVRRARRAARAEREAVRARRGARRGARQGLAR